jgi:hypothetical protein
LCFVGILARSCDLLHKIACKVGDLDPLVFQKCIALLQIDAGKEFNKGNHEGGCDIVKKINELSSAASILFQAEVKNKGSPDSQSAQVLFDVAVTKVMESSGERDFKNWQRRTQESVITSILAEIGSSRSSTSSLGRFCNLARSGGDFLSINLDKCLSKVADMIQNSQFCNYAAMLVERKESVLSATQTLLDSSKQSNKERIGIKAAFDVEIMQLEDLCVNVIQHFASVELPNVASLLGKFSLLMYFIIHLFGYDLLTQASNFNLMQIVLA